MPGFRRCLAVQRYSASRRPSFNKPDQAPPGLITRGSDEPHGVCMESECMQGQVRGGLEKAAASASRVGGWEGNMQVGEV